MAYNKTISKSSLDAGLGLIYRLNTLFNKAEDSSMTGDFEKWNFILDRVYINLNYKYAMDIDFEYDEQRRPIKVNSIEIPREEKIVYDKFSQLIKQNKIDSATAIKLKNKKLFHKLKEEYYYLLMKKDIWLRKLMMERGLYLKETDFDPSRALWGG